MKKFFSNIKNFYTNPDTKVKAWVVTGSVFLAVISIILLIVLLSGSKTKDEKTVENETVSEEKEVKEKPNEEITKAIEVTPEPTVTEEPTPMITPELTPEPVIEEEPQLPDYAAIHKEAGEVQSVINGTWVKEEIAKKRPYTFMFNNISVANPQSGIGDADILYEILVEAGITRCMGVFENMNEENSCKDRIGSARSARHYFASIASEYDSIFIHYGETCYATKKIAALNLDHLEGTHAEGSTVFYRDKNIKAPHNAFAFLAGIEKAIANKKFRTEHNEDFVPQHFDFAFPEGSSTSIDKVIYEYIKAKKEAESTRVSAGSGESGEPTAALTGAASGESGEPAAALVSAASGESGESTAVDEPQDPYAGIDISDIEGITVANYVKIPFSDYTKPYLTYDSETRLYTRFQFGGVHIDYNTKEALKFNNVIIQLVQESNRDKNGYQDIEGYSDKKGHNGKVSGKGYYICEGKCIEIKWEKDEKAFTCNYYSLDGQRLVLRPGKTFIAVYPDSREKLLEISEEKK